MAPRGWLLVPVLVAAVVSGCGAGDDGPSTSSSSLDFLPGERVGQLAEEQLEAEHPKMATGTITCPDLDWTLDASVRCVKVSELSEGRRVKIPGTVTVTGTEGGGKLHVELDDKATEFGVDAAHLSSVATVWVTQQAGSAGTVTCPYLTGVVDTTVRCTAKVGDEEAVLLVRVTDVEPSSYTTLFSFAWDGAGPTSKASPTFVAG